MTVYVSTISSLLGSILATLRLVGSNLDSYPLLVYIIAFWVIIAAVYFVFRLLNN